MILKKLKKSISLMLAISLTAAVLVGSAVVSVLPDVIVSALTKYAAGAIFGGI